MSNVASTEQMSSRMQKLEADIKALQTDAERLDASERFEFQNQLDVLQQRKQTVADRLEALCNMEKGECRPEMQTSLENELQDLQKAVRNVAKRVGRF